MSLVIAVDSANTRRGVVSVALVYPSEMKEPEFQYKDGRGAKRTEGLGSFGRFNEVQKSNVIRYLREAALVSTAVPQQDGDRDALETQAVGRAVERLRFFYPALLQKREDVEIHLTKHELPQADVGFIQQVAWPDPADVPWYSLAARIVAKATLPCILRGL